MDQKHNRIFPVWIEVRRLHHETLDARFVGGIHPKILERSEGALREQRVIQMRERDGRAAARTGAINFGGRRPALAGIDHGLVVAGELHVVQRAGAAHNDAGSSAGGRNHFDILPSAILHGEKQGVGIGRPGETFHPAVQRIGEHVDAASGAIEHHQSPAIALITCASLAAIRQQLAIGRILRALVGAGIAGDFDCIAADDRNDEQVRIGADGGHRVGIHRIADFFGIGRDSIVIWTAE